MYIFMVLIASFMALAQHSEQPQQESNSDLRSAMVLFSVEDISNEKTIILERTPHLDHFLRLKEEKDKEVIRKIDSRDAKKMEMDFASRFLKTQYELDTLPGNCKVVYKLVLKGESQDICKKDDKKGQEIAPFMQALNKRF
ncbi:MAG TPA: hypothetical protein VNJ08_16405 [Bacteriovoracaceae bacterium]|nr:hypothetical protein [Bacteriovoracaceae bacterium]